MSKCSCERVYNYLEFELIEDNLLFSVDQNYITTSTYIDSNDDTLKISVIFETNTNEKDTYFCTSEITYFQSDKESNNTLIESTIVIQDIDKYKDRVHELLSTFLYDKAITSKLIKNVVGAKPEDITRITDNNSFTIKLFNKNEKKYAAITISNVLR